ncbi:hypothetical protein FRB94_007947 [Tulasnella sp. JGI-2019a]|nr:hypothetical protein FRB93_005030 [Tulasnella sp. JGI-2019a]KAG8996959.1 hypothetical protein FRB94_007947 [Tulasnella sp. JGI-2019a]
MSTSLQQQKEPATIIDVRQEDSESISTAIAALRTQILAGLHKPTHQRTLPPHLIYDERGLRLFDELTTNLDAYYIFRAEEQILTDHSKDMAAMMGAGKGEAIIVELGAGALRKTGHVLSAFANTAVKAPTPSDKAPIIYYALDLERRELLRSLDALSGPIGEDLKGKVDIRGMWGTYDGGIAFIRSGGLVQDAAITQDSEKSSPPRFKRFSQQYEARKAPVIPSDETPRPSSPASSEDNDNRTVSDSASRLFTDNGGTHQTAASTASPSERERNAKGGGTTRSRSASPMRFGEEAERMAHPPLHFLFLGSSIGNFPRNESAEFLKSLPLRPGSGDTILLGIDHCNDVDVIKASYVDPQGYSARFGLNGLRVAERVLEGHSEDLERDYGNIFKKDGWDFVGIWNDVERRHESHFKSLRKQALVIPPDIDRPQDPETYVEFEEGELVHYEVSVKFSTAEALAMFSAANLRVVNRWTDNNSRFSVWLLERPPFNLPTLPSLSHAPPMAPSTPLPVQKVFPSVPTLAEWSQLWALWDMVTMKMIPEGMLHQKPIDLRHKCLFYFGHIPTFLDIHLTRAARRLGGKEQEFTEPEYFTQIFERGIDPHVDDPDTCHPHSEVPTADEDWPTLEVVIGYRDRVRARVMRVYVEHGRERVGSADPTIRDFDRDLGRVLWMTWEHEAMHLETLLYMLLQKAGDEGGTIPPTGFIPPAWEILSQQKEWSDDLASSPPSTVVIGPADVPLGHDDFEAEDAAKDSIAGLVNGAEYQFGWDNESPRRIVKLDKAIRVETRPILISEYHAFWKKGQDGTDGCRKLPASWILDPNGDVQVRTLYGPIPLRVAKNWPFIGSYDELHSYAASKGGRLPTEAELHLYRDMYEGSEESNIGFTKWHSIPPKVATGPDNRGHNGGVWEWTSTVWDTHEGFKSSMLYPGYSSDFFDTKHQTVIGGSYATVPRLAQRRSFRNWFQHNYPYSWIGGRIAYDGSA